MEFVNTVEIKPVYVVDSILTIDEMEQALRASSNGSTTYTVAEGDTYYGIAYANDMSLSDLMALNPQANLDRLMVGDVLNVKELTPVLSVQTVEDVTYTEAIECPVETREDPTMYKGNSKIITQGVEGESQVNATVTYVNGQETNRVVNSTTVLREATTTVKAVGTKEKPKTASTGSYQWPISGRITSYFGGRYIFGSYSYHSGLDISCSYGAPSAPPTAVRSPMPATRLLRQSGHHYPRQRHPDLLRPQLVPVGLHWPEGVQGPADRQGGLYRTVYRRALSL